MPLTQDQLTMMYLAYFGRPPDMAGMAYYMAQPDLTLQQLEINFSNSPESKAMYSAMSTGELIDDIYMTLFNRHAEPDGVMFWSNAIDTGQITSAGAAYEILHGAQNDDMVTVHNKLMVAQAWDQHLDMASEMMGYSGDMANTVARAFLQDVTSTNMAEMMPEIDTMISQSITWMPHPM